MKTKTFKFVTIKRRLRTNLAQPHAHFDRTKAIVAEPEAGWCDGTKAAGLLKGGDIHTTVAVNEAVNTMSF